MNVCVHRWRRKPGSRYCVGQWDTPPPAPRYHQQRIPSPPLWHPCSCRKNTSHSGIPIQRCQEPRSISHCQRGTLPVLPLPAPPIWEDGGNATHKSQEKRRSRYTTCNSPPPTLLRKKKIIIIAGCKHMFLPVKACVTLRNVPKGALFLLPLVQRGEATYVFLLCWQLWRQWGARVREGQEGQCQASPMCLGETSGCSDRMRMYEQDEAQENIMDPILHHPIITAVTSSRLASSPIFCA